MDHLLIAKGTMPDQENYFPHFRVKTSASKRGSNCPSSISKRQALGPVTNCASSRNFSRQLCEEREETQKHQAIFPVTDSHLTVPPQPSCVSMFPSTITLSLPPPISNSCGFLNSSFNSDNSLTSVCSISACVANSSLSLSTSIHCLSSHTSPGSFGSPMLVSSPDNGQSVVSDAELLGVVDIDLQDSTDDSSVGIYAREIFYNLRQSEAIHHPNPTYMHKQPDITCGMRAILVDWLVEVTDEFRLDPQTLFLSVTYVDSYLSRVSVTRSKLQLVGTTCMYLAAKVEEIYPPEIGEFAYITDDTYSKKQIVKMERHLLKELDFQLIVPTIHTFLLRFLKASHTDTSHDGNVKQQVEATSKYLCELALLDSEPFLKYLPSTVAASAVCLARHTIGITAWPPVMVCYSNYRVADISHCIQDLHRALAMARCHPQQAIRRKYNTEKFLMVSSLLKAPETLPY